LTITGILTFTQNNDSTGTLYEESQLPGVNERWSIHFLNSYKLSQKWKVKFERPLKEEAPNLENEDTAILLHGPA
jgi:hypothetical protein